MPSPTARPSLSRELSAREFQRWYWLRTELVLFAQSLGIRATGGKELLTARIATVLDGREFVEPPRASTSSNQLSAPLNADTVIPLGQRCSQVVRAWLSAQVGPTFQFDAAMRTFFAEADGTQTMQDALDHWHHTRNRGPRSIDPQFEYNRFTRAWHAQHPAGTRDELLVAWQEYRSRPTDERGRI